MNGIKEIRQMLGISQSELAEHLGIPKANLSMAEANHRMLPAVILLKIADLQLKINKSRGQRIDALSRQERPAKVMVNDLPIESMNAKAHHCYYKIHVLNGKLNVMSDQYDYLRQCQAAIEAVLSTKMETDEDYIFWKWQHEKTLAKLNNCSLLKQDELRLKIKMLETETLYYK